MDATVAPPTTAVSGPVAERVGFGSRLGAYVIDLVVIWGLAAVTSRALSGLFPHAVEMTLASRPVPPGSPAAGPMMEMFVRWAIAGTVVTTAYFLLEGLLGRALGKLILGLRIAGDNARRAPVTRLLARGVVKTAGAWVKLLALSTGVTALSRGGDVVGLIILGGCLLALWPRRQALHDLIARTAVFHASDVGAEAAADRARAPAG
jgi:uncharacterized RDD family membrane protein YckC